jgi:hypothetical protein
MTPRHFPSLGFDPTPGHVPTATQIARGVSDTAGALAEISALLSGAADGEWRGKAAIAFRDLLAEDFRPKVAVAARSFDIASQVLHGWVETMRDAQGRAACLEARHAEAVRAARAARATLAGIPSVAGPLTADPTPEELRAERDRLRARADAGRTVSAADAEVQRLLGQARTLEQTYGEDGRQAAARLQHAMDIAPNEPGFWGRLAEEVGAALESLGDIAAELRDRVVALLEEYAPLLDFIGDIASTLGMLAGFLAMIPGLQVLGLVALGLGGIALGAHYLAAVGESGSFLEAMTDKDVLMDAAGLVLGAGAIAVSGKMVSVAVRTAPAGVVRTADDVPGLFALARTTGYQMSEPELMWRLGKYHVDAAGLGVTTVGIPQNVEAVGKIPGNVEQLFRGNFSLQDEKWRPAVAR